MKIYFRLFILSILISSCSQRATEGNSSVFSFLNTEASIPNLTLPEYKTWLEDSAHHTFVSLANDSFKVTMMYRPAAFESALALSNSTENFQTIFKEKDKYHLFVAECLDKRSATAMKLKGGMEFINNLSKGVFVIQNDKDTILPIIETFPSMILNKPSNIYMLIPKDNLSNSYKACLFHPMLGFNDVLSIRIDSTAISTLPKIKL